MCRCVGCGGAIESQRSDPLALAGSVQVSETLRAVEDRGLSCRPACCRPRPPRCAPPDRPTSTSTSTSAVAQYRVPVNGILRRCTAYGVTRGFAFALWAPRK